MYELVVRHYLACVSQPAVAAETTVEIDIAGERFSASGRAILAVRLVPHYFCACSFSNWILTLFFLYVTRKITLRCTALNLGEVQ